MIDSIIWLLGWNQSDIQFIKEKELVIENFEREILLHSTP